MIVLAEPEYQKVIIYVHRKLLRALTFSLHLSFVSYNDWGVHVHYHDNVVTLTTNAIGFKQRLQDGKNQQLTYMYINHYYGLKQCMTTV